MVIWTLKHKLPYGFVYYIIYVWLFVYNKQTCVPVFWISVYWRCKPLWKVPFSYSGKHLSNEAAQSITKGLIQHSEESQYQLYLDLKFDSLWGISILNGTVYYLKLKTAAVTTSGSIYAKYIRNFGHYIIIPIVCWWVIINHLIRQDSLVVVNVLIFALFTVFRFRILTPEFAFFPLPSVWIQKQCWVQDMHAAG